VLHSLHNSYDLLGGLALSKDDFRKSFAQGTVVIDVSIGNVFIGQMLESCSRVGGAGLAMISISPKMLYWFRVNVKPGKP
jgi:hypothetical protein